MDDFATLVEEARTHGFVGRRAQLSAFDDVLAGRSGHRVMFVHGAGGMGKTTLLHRLRHRAEQAGRPVLVVDGREVAASPAEFELAVELAAGSALPAPDGEGNGAGRLPGAVVLVDGYDQLAAIDTWLRERYLPGLHATTSVVLLGRLPPHPAWRTDPGWRSVTAVHELVAFDDLDSTELLRRAGAPAETIEHLGRLGRGHPLTLALLADVARAGTVPADLAEAPDLVAALAPQVVDVAPDDAHALGLALCAHAWLTTTGLLRAAVGDRADEVWEWLESRPFVSRGPQGLYPHDLVREVLDADLRRRAPDLYRQVHRTVRECAMTGLRDGDADERSVWAHQKLFLHRNSPLAAAFWAMRHQGAGAVVPAGPEDHGPVLAMLQRYEPPASVALAEQWFAAQPENLVVVRSAEGVAGFHFHVLHPVDSGLADADPVVRATLAEVARRGAPRPGEQVSIGRFCAGVDHYQRDARAVVAGAVASTTTWAAQPLAWSFIATVDPEFWTPVCDYLALDTRFPVEWDGRTYTVFGIDWRRLPVDSWFDLMGERQLTGRSGPAPASLLRPAPLSRRELRAAVRDALRSVPRPDRLAGSDLLRSRLAVGPSGASPERLAATLRAAVERLGGEPRSEPLRAVLDRTYLRPAPTQEAAADVLGLPFSTYRRHHDRALERLADLLWAVEIGEVRLAVPAVADGGDWAGSGQRTAW